MISAIAARKAAQTAKLTGTTQPLPSVPKNDASSNQEPESDPDHLETVPHKSKRRSGNSQISSIQKKRRKKNPKTQVRYFDEINVDDAAQKIADRNDDTSSSSSDSDEGIQEVLVVDGDIGEIAEVQQSRKQKRSWSPSRLAQDSSDDELDLSAPVSSRHIRSQDGGYQFTPSPTFDPQPQKNIFYCDGQLDGYLANRKGSIIALSEGETMALLGVYSLIVLRGGISLLGSELYASSSRTYTVFAPKCSPIPIIKAIPSGGTSSFPLPKEITRTVDASSTVLFFEDVHSGVEGLGCICRTFENAFETSFFCKDVLKLSSAGLITSISRSLQAFQLPDSWLNAFASLPPTYSEDNPQISESLTLLVRGQKRTGKSTLARTLVNRLVCRYRRVAYLECDLGQTEFTPPGLVSLNVIDDPVFGPPFTHPRLPYASHFIGAATPKDSPSHYLAALSALLQTYRLELQHPAPEDQLCDTGPEDSRVTDVVPLVVNTMGWLKGLGADLSRQIEDLVEPTHIFTTQPESSGMTDPVSRGVTRFSGSDGWESSGPRIFEVEAISPNPNLTRYTAADWRTLSLMSYFHSVPSPVQFEFLPTSFRPTSPPSFDPRAPLCTWDCGLPLVAQVPFAVTTSEAIDSIVLVGPGAEDVVPSEVPRVLNGSIVALVSRDIDSSEYPSHASPRTALPYSQGIPPPDPSTSNCIGLALIRGVSPSLFASTRNDPSALDDRLHILTPVPPALVSAPSARCFVKGQIELPVCGMLDYREFGRVDLRSGKNISVPYLQWSRNDVIGGEKRRVRRNIMRREQL